MHLNEVYQFLNKGCKTVNEHLSDGLKGPYGEIMKGYHIFDLRMEKKQVKRCGPQHAKKIKTWKTEKYEQQKCNIRFLT